MILNFSLDSSVSGAPVGFTAALNSIASFFDNTFLDPVTVNIAVGYGEIAGEPLSSGALGESESFLRAYSYAQLKSALISDAKTANDASAVASLPVNDPTGGQYWVSTAEAKALGLAGGSGLDGYVGFGSNYAFDYNDSDGVAAGQFDFFGTVAHEVSEIMGRQLLTGATIGTTPNGFTPFDLFHFSSPRSHIFSGTQAGYFSVDNGATNLDNFNTNPGGDFGDWAASAGNDAASAFSARGVVNVFSQTDITAMDVLGWDVSAAPPPPPPVTTPIETFGATTLATAANHFYLLDSTGAGPSLKYNGADVVAGQFGPWLPIAAEKISTGYEIAFKVTGADQYSLWTTDTNGNHVLDLIGPVSGSDSTLQSSETLFQQDINGDGHIGVTGAPPGTTPIETFGATTLATAANHFYLLDSTGAGPSLKYNGADVVAGQFGPWLPIAAEKISTGYEIAFKVTGADQYSLWTTDTNGNHVLDLIGPVSGSDSTLQSSETLFQQDINGDGHIGVTGAPPGTTPIETFGATTLATAANHFYLLDSTGAGPSLKYNGADVVAGQFGPWLPIAAEKISTGYEIAFKVTGADQYSLWTTDTNGNHVLDLIGPVSGSDSTLQSSETLFQQDINGDGHIGVTGAPPGTTPIETFGATTLATAANHFYLLDSTGAGPSLKYNGTDVVAGQFGPWLPITAEKISTGYEIAFKVTGADQYSLWTTDTNGNHVLDLIGPVSGSDSTLQSSETLFQQDINGDGHIGGPGATMASEAELSLAINFHNDTHHDWLL